MCQYSGKKKKKRTIFLERFEVQSTIDWEVQRFPITAPSHMCTASPIINICLQSGTFVTTGEPALAHHNHPKSIVYITVHS